MKIVEIVVGDEKLKTNHSQILPWIQKRKTVHLPSDLTVKNVCLSIKMTFAFNFYFYRYKEYKKLLVLIVLSLYKHTLLNIENQKPSKTDIK